MRCLLALMLACPSVAFVAEPLPMPREVRVDPFGDRLPDGVIARLGTTRLKHPFAKQVTFALEGRTFATRDDGAITIWSAATGERLQHQSLYREEGSAKWTARDGRRAAIQTSESLQIWDLSANRLIRSLPIGDAVAFGAVAFADNDDGVVTVDWTPREHRIRIWSLSTGTNRVIGIVTAEVDQLMLSTDGKKLFTSSLENGCVTGWDVAAEKQLWQQHFGLQRIRITPNGERVFVCWMDSKVEQKGTVLDGLTSKPVSKANLAIGYPYYWVEKSHAQDISPDGQYVVVDHRDGIRLLEVNSAKVIRTFPESASSASFSPNGQILALVQQNGLVQAFDIKSGKALYADVTDSGHTSTIRSIAWSSDGKRIATAVANGDDYVRIWNAADGKLIHRLPNLHHPTAGLEFSDDGRSLWTCGHRSPLLKWDVATGKEVKKWFIVHDDDYEKPYGQILAIKMLHEGTKARMLLVGNEEREPPFVATYDLESGKFEGEKGVVLPFHLLDQTHLLDNVMAGAGQVYRPATGEELPPLGEPDDEDQWIDTRLSRDTWLIAGGRWKQISDRPRSSPTIVDAVVFERSTGRPLLALPQGPAGKYAFSPNGRHFAVAAPDGIHIWDLAARKETRFIKGHDRFDAYSLDSFATAIAFSPDGKRIATGHADTTILVWDVVDRQAETHEAANGATGSPEPFDMDRLWTDLADPDPRKGLAAVFTLQDHPEQAFKLLRDRLVPTKEPANVRDLIARLDDDNFRQREAARKLLAEHGDAAKPAMQAALNGRMSEEQKKHIDKLFTELNSRQPPRGNDLRGIRGLMILEKLNTPESRRLIGELAKGMESARLTREANDAQERLR